MASWQKVDPDSVFDDLPEPYRSINKIIEDVILGVYEGIDVLESRRKSAEYEFDLLQAVPTSALLVSGCITSAYAEARGSTRLALGFSHGEVVIADTRTREVLASTRPFRDGEAVKCVLMASDGMYHQTASVPGQPPQERLRPTAKVMVSGVAKPAILVYDICKEPFGVMLHPFCAIHVPEPDEGLARAENDPDAEVVDTGKKTPIEQLHARGTHGAIWVVALLFNHTIRAYLCPLGLPENNKMERQESMASQAIPEDEEAEGENEAANKDFGNVMQINTPQFCFSLPSMVPLPGLPEPPLDSLSLSVFTLRSTGAAQRSGASQVPTFCFLASTESNYLFCYSLRGPPQTTGAKEAAGMEAGAAVTMEALLKQVVPPPGTLKEPAEALGLTPHRRWLLPGKTSAMAVSPDGGSFAAGGSQGSLALINSAAGPSLQSMLSGHYDAVVALAFHRSDVLISIGADSWIHIFDGRLGTLRARFLSSRPPSPPPAMAAAASFVVPMALTLDAHGGMRLLDLARSRKMARALCRSQEDLDRSGFSETSAGYPPADVPPVQVLATASGFSVLCYDKEKLRPPTRPVTADSAAETPDAGARPDSGGGETADAESPAPISPEPAGNSYVVFFEHLATLSSLYPGIAARVAAGDSAVALFENLSLQEMLEKPQEGRLLDRTNTLSQTQSTRLGGTRASTVQRKQSMMMGASRKSVASAGSASALARLTTENLQKLDKPSQTAKSQQSMSNSQVAASAGNVSRGTRAGAGGQAIPENWQVTVKRHLRNSMADKQIRQAKIQKHMEAVRKELEG